MSVKPTTVYVIACDGYNCPYEYQDLEFGHTITWMTATEADNEDCTYQEWTRVGPLHFCDQPGCQEEAAAEKKARADRQPIPPLPGQLDLLAEVP